MRVPFLSAGASRSPTLTVPRTFPHIFLALRIQRIVNLVTVMTAGAHPASMLRTRLEAVVNELYEKSAGKNYGMTSMAFANILTAIAEKYLPFDSRERDLHEFYLSLRIEELALARACADGNERAWQDFMLRYRDKLHDIAIAITKEESQARELAGSIYADLYGTANREGRRISKLSYYNGRGSLEGWLRTVMAQTKVNQYRGARHTVSLEEENEHGRQFESEPQPSEQAIDPRLNTAIDAALAAISAQDRLTLAYYFLDDLTLARIAAVLGVHESTISRRLEKLVKALRKDILHRLTHSGLSRLEAEEALEVDVRDLTVDIRRRLTQDSPAAAFPEQKAIRAGEGQD